jgi:hypothetical protein
MHEEQVFDKLSEIRDDLADLTTSVALNNLAYTNLNAELQEHKKDSKWRVNRNIAVVAIVFTALGCWVALKGMDTGTAGEQTAIVKEVTSSGKTIKDN